MSSVLPDAPKYQSSSFWNRETPRYSILWESPTPNANGHYWRIWTSGHVEVLPSGWKPGDPHPQGSEWPTAADQTP